MYGNSESLVIFYKNISSNSPFNTFNTSYSEFRLSERRCTYRSSKINKKYGLVPPGIKKVISTEYLSLLEYRTLQEQFRAQFIIYWVLSFNFSEKHNRNMRF